MTNKNIHSPSNYLFSKQLNLSDFNFEKPAKNFIKRHLKNHNEDLTNNQLLKFIETTFILCKNKFKYFILIILAIILYTQPCFIHNFST